MTQAGQFNKNVTFQRVTRTSDGGGGYADAWNAVSGLTDVPAQFMPERGRERVEAGRLEAALGGVLRVRAFTESLTITEDDRVLIDDVAFQIRSVANPDQRNKTLEMTVEKGVAT